MSNIEAVCFDLDSTLCVRDDQKFHDSIFERVDIDPFFAPADVNAVDPTTFPPVDTITEFWESVFRAVAANVGGDPGHATQLAGTTVEVLVEDPPVRFRDGAADALEHVRRKFDLGLVTQGSVEMQTAKLDALGISGVFDAMVFCGKATDLGGKPDPAPFQEVLAELAAVPEETIYVGDTLEKDIVGAHNAGMKSVWVPVGDSLADPDPEPTHRLNVLTDLPTVLR